MKRTFGAALVLVAWCVWSQPAFGQSQAINGTIEGTVRDVSGAVLPGVTVTVLNTDTGTQRVVVTNEAGIYRAPLLPLGLFKVTFTLTGFQGYARDAVRLNAGSDLVLDATLKVGLTETVTVNADPPEVDLGKIDTGRNITEMEVKNLPNVSRNPYNFALLEAGVTGFENEEYGVPRFAVNGQMERVNYQVDGSTNTEKDRAGLRLMPMSEVMIQEVQVTSSGYAPEFGQTTGMVYNVVTPSGTNKLRGDAGFRFRLKDWSAFPFFFTQPKTEANRPNNSLQVYTADAGGPAMRNKLFYYFGTEHTYQDQATVITLDPNVVAAVGAPPQPGTTPGFRSVLFTIAKADWQVNEAHRVTFRYDTFHNDNPFNAGAGGANTVERGIDFDDAHWSTGAQVVSTLGGSRLNELRVQVAQRIQKRFAHDPADRGVLDLSINVAGGTVNGVSNNINFGQPNGDGQDFRQRITQALDNFTYIRGRHSYKAGIDAQWVADERSVPLPATYTFPSIQAYNDAKAGLTPKSYTTFAQTLGTSSFSFDDALFSAFGQDDWKVKPSFKLLYGVRYDYYMYPHGIPNAPYNSTFHRDGNNVAPRGGFAWTLDKSQRTVLRGNIGIMYDQPLLAIVENAYNASGLANRTTAVSLNPASPNAPAFPNTLAGLPVGTVQVSATVQGMAPDFVTAYTWQNGLTLERGLGNNYTLSIGGRYTRGYDLPVINDVNLVGITPVSYLDDGRGVYSAAVNATTRVDPRYNHVRLVESVGESWYKALTLQLNKRWSHGIQYNLNYTYASAVDTAPLGGAVLAVQGDAARSDPANLARDKAPPQLAIVHTFNGSIVGISSVHRYGSLMNAILSDNQVGLILQFNSGQPVGLSSNRDLNLDGQNGDRPVFETRNSLYLPARWNVDMRYSRMFPFAGGRRLEVQGEFKNVFNIEQISAVAGTIAVDAAGYPVDASGVRLTTPISHNAADYSPTAGYEQRKFQLGFVFHF
jgi:hypothetical protein